MRQKKIILPKLCDCGGNPEKQWYVYYSYLDDTTGKLCRFKIKDGFNEILDIKNKRKHASKLIYKYKKKLLTGWNPFESNEKVVYSNRLIYDNAVDKKFKGKKTVYYKLSKFLSEKKKMLAHSSYKTYQSELRVFEDFLRQKKLLHVSIAAITETHAKSFFDWIEEKRGITSNTKNKYRVLLIAVWNYYKRENNLLENVWSKVPKFKQYIKSQKPLKQNILEMLKEELQETDPQLWLAAQFLYYCFIRPKELRFMKIGDIDLFDGKITLQSDITKNAKTRIVDIPSHFCNKLIKEYKLNKYPENFHVFSTWQEPNIKGVGKNYFAYRFKTVRDNLGIPDDYKFYGFKHTGAVVSMRNGADIKDIQNQMGHHSILVTDEYLKNLTGYESDFFKNKLPEI